MAPVTPSPRYVTVEQAISLSTDSLFDFDSSKIKQPDSFSPFAEQLKAYPDGTIRVVGYTDASGPERYNQRLSEQRAQAVANYLEQQGVASERMTVIGLGESNPMASNETTEGRALNRRVEVLFDTVVQETQEVTETRVEE
nr:OmpA family protein [Vibrio sp. V43_P6S15P86]